jgi:uncharacterized SAM-binding protein YcdF (DUF218 family)
VRGRKILFGLGVLVAVVFFIIALTPVSNYAGEYFTVGETVKPSGAIVVLAAGLWKGGMLDDQSLRRTIKGIELFKNNLAPLVVMSGKEIEDEPLTTEAEARKQMALTMGVPAEAILKEETANTTRDEAVLISKMLVARNVHRILLVSESLHMRRAKYLFERAGMEVNPAPSDNFTVASISPGDRIRLAMRVLQESLAIIYYKTAGYI